MFLPAKISEPWSSLQFGITASRCVQMGGCFVPIFLSVATRSFRLWRSGIVAIACRATTECTGPAGDANPRLHREIDDGWYPEHTFPIQVLISAGMAFFE